MGTGADVQRQVDRARSLRRLAAFGALVNAFLIVADLAGGSVPAIPAAALVVFLVLVLMQTHTIRTLERVRELNRHAGRLELAAKILTPAARPSCAHPAAESVDLFNPSSGKYDGERVAWVCPDCNTDLPAGWSPQAKGAGAGGGGGGEYVTMARVAEPRPARLPAMLRETTIATMKPGRTYWTVPWAMMADEEGRMWLYSAHTADGQRCGTVEMRVERRDDGYHVWPVPGKTYAPRAVGGQCVPVAVLEGPAGELPTPPLSGTGSLSAPMTGPGGRWRPLSELRGTVVEPGGIPAAPLIKRMRRELEAHAPGKVTWDDVAYPSEASAHFAALARVGREHCASYCPICLYRLFGPMPDGSDPRLQQWLAENWGWKR